MKYSLILVLFLLVSACANDEGDGSISPYPVADYAIPIKSQFCSNRSVAGTDCDDLFKVQFKVWLNDYYGGTLGLFSGCDSNPYLCRDEYAMEDLIKNIRAGQSWGWYCGHPGCTDI